MSEKQFLLTMEGSNKEIIGIEDKHILDSMLAIGIDVAPKGCHGGGCGVCKIKITKGEVTTLSQSRKFLSKEEEENGYVLACRAFPVSDIEFEFIGKPKCKVNEKKKYGFV